MIRIHADSFTPKYKSGKWSWDKNTDALHFQPHSDLEDANDRFIETNGYRFLRMINQEEEVIFRKLFTRSPVTYDTDIVVINDVRDLVLFMMPKEFLTKKFLDFMHKPPVHRLVHALIIYFEYFLRLVEFLLIRRDELSGNMAQVQSEQTNEMKRIFSSYLSQYRMLVARNYSIIIMGEGDMAAYYHTIPIVNISTKIKDKYFHEQFLAVAIQIIWISMHRRAYFIIEMEMNRLFRSEHFLMNNPQYLKFTPSERSLLYGRNNKMVNYRAQCSPMIQELTNVSDEDLPILWIGERKYRGDDYRIHELELEYIVPGPQLRMIDISHGILGHPKRLYDTMLRLDWSKVRFNNFSKLHDPYHLVRQPNLRMPNIDEMKLRRLAKNYEHFYKIFRIYEPFDNDHIIQWTQREKILQAFCKAGIHLDIFSLCESQLTQEEKRNVPQIISKYYNVIYKFRKKSHIFLGDATSTNKKSFKFRGNDRFFYM
ncbi:hypothetical protein KR093_009426 [Drosophila rubida]|uniref:Protein phosphatase 1 regulatory subunit 36 n=1 Tax=Drosophila rubida TaxID=30044 RepID=A0AAD4PLA2_9MUSC|nr:hypothetical protein KR093_009426 [Drosophila rubida]